MAAGCLPTFGVCPVGVEIGQGCLVADLLERFRWLMVDLENTTRPSPAATRVRVGHFVVCASALRGVVTRVKGDGALEKDWGRQLGGVSESARLVGGWTYKDTSQTLVCSRPWRTRGDSCQLDYMRVMWRSLSVMGSSKRVFFFSCTATECDV